MTPQNDPATRVRSINRTATVAYALVLLASAAAIAGFAWAGR